MLIPDYTFNAPNEFEPIVQRPRTTSNIIFVPAIPQ